MIVLSTFLTLGFFIFLLMCYIACFPGAVKEKGDDFKELPFTSVTNTRKIETMEMAENLNIRNRESLEDIQYDIVQLEEEKNCPIKKREVNRQIK